MSRESKYLLGFNEGRLASEQEVEALRAALSRISAYHAKWRREAQVRLGWFPNGQGGLTSPVGWAPFECDKRD